MSSEEPEANAPSEYEVSQYFAQQGQWRDVSDESYRELKREYGRIRAWAKINPDRFRDLQRNLNQARMGTTHDIYLAKSVRYALAVTGVGIVVGVLLAWLLAVAGVFSGLQSPVAVDGGWVELIRANKELLAAGISALLVGVVAGSVTLVARYYYPRLLVSSRRQNIDFLLPHAIVYMYALSYGGMNLVEVITRLAESEDAYGEVAREFDAISRDVELFGNDLMTALRNARNITPSERLERFLDDLVSVLDTGGDVTTFLEDATGTYLEEAQEEQEDFLETLSVFSEIYITAFVATPLFLVVILMVTSFLGGSGISEMYTLIYLGFPLGMAAFLGLIAFLSSAYAYPDTELDIRDEDAGFDVSTETVADDKRFKRYDKSKRWKRLRQFLRTPLSVVRRKPIWTLAITVPLTLVYFAVVLVTGTVDPGSLLESPIRTTAWLAVYPFLILAVPLSLFYELERGRQNAILSRFPDSLNVLSSANNMGIQFPDALELLSRYSSGVLAREFRVTRNDLLWSGNLNRSLLAFGNRIDIPQLSRTVKIIADGVRSSGDLARILSIAAKDTRDRYRILRKRRRAMSSYIAVVVIGFLVYLMVIVFLDVGYLQPIEALPIDENIDSRGLPISLSRTPSETYRMLFFHSVLIQAVGTGAIAGELADNDVLSGLKYSIGLVALSLVVFTFIHP